MTLTNAQFVLVYHDNAHYAALSRPRSLNIKIDETVKVSSISLIE